MLTAQQDSLYYLVHTSDNQASCMLKKFTNIWSKSNLNNTIPELLSSKQAISPFHEACQMNEVIGGYLSGYKIASFLARRDLASLSRWPNLLLLSLSLRGCRRPAQNHPCVQREPGVGGGGLLGRRLPRKRRAASTAWSLSPRCAQRSHVVGRLVGALCSLPPKAFLPPLSFDTPFSSHRCRRHLSARGMPFVCRHSSRPASIDPAPPLKFFAAPVRSPLPMPMPPSSPQLAS